MKGIIILFASLLLIISIGESYKIPSNPPSNYLSQSGTRQSTINGNPSGDSGITYITKSEDHYYSTSGYSGDNIEIRKSITPNNRDYYLINRLYNMSVEVKGTKWEVNNIFIKEHMDFPIKITNISEISPRIIDPFNNAYSPISKANYKLDTKNNTILLSVKKLKPNHRIEYNYNILSNEVGLSESNTIVRVGNTSVIRDIDYSKEILMSYPSFDVNVDVEKLHLFDDFDLLHIRYNVLHKSSCLDPICCNISFENFNSDEYTLYRKDKDKLYHFQPMELIFNSANHTPIDVYVRYKNAGPHRIPAILIEGRPYTFDVQIDVSRRVPYWTEEFYPLLSLIAFIITIICTVYYEQHQLKLMREELKYMRKELSVTHQKLIKLK